MINKLKKHQDQIPYDMLSRKVVQSLRNPIALSIWTYLQSKSDNWDVVESHIRQHFDVGRLTYMKAMKELRDAGLYEFVRHKDDGNSFTGGHYHIYPFPQVSESIPMETRTDIKEKEIVKEKESIKEEDIMCVSRFDEFWKAYPRGEKKKLAKERFMKLSNSKQELAVKDVTSGMARFNEYIPHASTYINDERWEDERAGQQATQRKVLSR